MLAINTHGVKLSKKAIINVNNNFLILLSLTFHSNFVKPLWVYRVQLKATTIIFALQQFCSN